MPDQDPITYKPSGFYYRRALRRTDDPAELRAIGLAVVAEHELLKEWVRTELGCIPPKFTVHGDEAADKRWSVIDAKTSKNLGR